jgi:hypothetical protein
MYYDYDIFILSDYFPRTHGERKKCFKEFRKSDSRLQLYRSTVRSRICRIGYKWVFLFFQDNNEVFERIREAGFKISCFVGVNDGCREGGNYECVNSPRWIEKVFTLFPEEGGLYITDHSPILNVLNVYPYSYDPIYREPYYPEFIFKNWRLKRIHSVYLSLFCSYSYVPGISTVLSLFTYPVAYKVTTHRYKCWKWISKTGILLTIEHDNIANHIDEIDGDIVSIRCFDLIQKLTPDIKAEVEVIYSDWRDNTTQRFTKRILQVAKERKWKIVGTTAYGNGMHEDIFSILDNWKEDYPEALRIFYLDSNDFSDIKYKMEEV